MSVGTAVECPISEVRMIYILAAVDPGDYPYERLAAVVYPVDRLRLALHGANPRHLSDMILSVFTY
jgi:hypothetical protein